VTTSEMIKYVCCQIKTTFNIAKMSC